MMGVVMAEEIYGEPHTNWRVYKSGSLYRVGRWTQDQDDGWRLQWYPALAHLGLCKTEDVPETHRNEAAEYEALNHALADVEKLERLEREAADRAGPWVLVGAE